MKISTRTLTGTAILGALVVVFDYALKYSNLKIPFIPPLQFLHFDFTGIPVVLSLLLFDFPSGVTTSCIAFFAIFARSGKAVSASMKAIAELSTILGMALGLRLFKKSIKLTKAVSFVLGITFRCLIMFFANLIVQPLYYGTPFMAVLLLSPLTGLFNAIQGSIGTLGGYILYEAVIRRTPLYSKITMS
jgi:riboflavin transporter FmnP